MKNKQIVFMDGFDQVIDDKTQKVVFKTQNEFGVIQEQVIDNVVILWNKTTSIEQLDVYLLDEPNCTQEDRETIVESLAQFYEGEAFQRADKAKEMCIEPLAFFTKHLTVLADETIARQEKNESLFGFLMTKVLGKSFEQWHTIINGDLPIDYQLVHNGLEQVKLFNQVYDKFTTLFDAVVKHIFDNNDYIVCFVDEFTKGNLMVTTLKDIPVDGLKLTITYRKHSPPTKGVKPIMAINFVIE